MSWLQQGSDIDGSASGDNFGLCVAISGNSTTIAVGAPNNTNGGVYSSNGNPGQVRVFKWDQTLMSGQGNWAQRGQDLNGLVGDFYGVSISLSANGNIVAIGAPGTWNAANKYTGYVSVYSWNGSVWAKRGVDIVGKSSNESCGTSVSLSANGDIIAIGRPAASSLYGGVSTYKWDQTQSSGQGAWVQYGQDLTGDMLQSSFGDSVSISADGTTMVVGAPRTDGNGTYSGRVRVYKWDQTQSSGQGAWVQRGSHIDGQYANDFFGKDVTISDDGTIIAIGANRNDNNGSNAGHVRVYIWDQTQSSGQGGWVQRGLDILGSVGDETGFSVSISANGSKVAVGDRYNTNTNGYQSGRVRVFIWDQTLRNGSGNWALYGTEMLGEGAGDQLGYSVAISADGETVVGGAIWADGTNGIDTGHARVYRYTPPVSNSVCFLADAPVLTPVGYRPISTIAVGDLVRTAAGRDVAVKRVFAKEYAPSAAATPYVIPKGLFGALRALPISPNHEVMVPGRGMIKAKNLGLQRMKMTAPFTYYNLELEDWVRDNLVVAGVECESLAPAKRITMTTAEFLHFVQARYGPSAAARLRSVCFEESDGRISMPALH